MEKENVKIDSTDESKLEYHVGELKSKLQILQKKRKSKPKYILCVLTSILIGFIVCIVIYIMYETIENSLQSDIAMYDIRYIQKNINEDDFLKIH